MAKSTKTNLIKSCPPNIQSILYKYKVESIAKEMTAKEFYNHYKANTLEGIKPIINKALQDYPRHFEYWYENYPEDLLRIL